MLAARTSREFHNCLYELEEHLALFPNSSQGRMLRDDLVTAMERAERM